MFCNFPKISNSKTKDAHEQLIEKFEGLNTIYDEEERKDNINNMDFC